MATDSRRMSGRIHRPPSHMEDYYEGSLSESDPCPRQMPPLLPPKNLRSKPGTNIRQPPQQQVQSQERQQFSNPPVTPFITQNQQR